MPSRHTFSISPDVLGQTTRKKVEAGMAEKKYKVYTTKERHDLLDALANEYKDDDASVKTIYAHWDEEGFDEGDYEELTGVLQLF